MGSCSDETQGTAPRSLVYAAELYYVDPLAGPHSVHMTSRGHAVGEYSGQKATKRVSGTASTTMRNQLCMEVGLPVTRPHRAFTNRVIKSCAKVSLLAVRVRGLAV